MAGLESGLINLLLTKNLNTEYLRKTYFRIYFKFKSVSFRRTISDRLFLKTHI